MSEATRYAVYKQRAMELGASIQTSEPDLPPLHAAFGAFMVGFQAGLEFGIQNGVIEANKLNVHIADSISSTPSDIQGKIEFAKEAGKL